MPLVSIVIPAFNEEGSLPELQRRLISSVDPLSDFEFEFVLVDNCSTDRTLEIAKAFAAQDPRWKIASFSRNFGAETSLAAGAHYAKGDAVIFLFSDLQEPPELIPEMIEKWQQGFDVVYGRLAERSDGSFIKTLGAKVAYKLINKLSDVQIPTNASDYKLVSRRALDALNACEERNRYLRGLVHWIGFKQVGIDYDRSEREFGSTTTDLGFLIRFALNAIIAFSTKPLELATIAGFGILAVSFTAGIIYIGLQIATSMGLLALTPPPPGWTTITLLILFFGGVQCIFIGIIGQYLGNVYNEVKQRPRWLIDEQVGLIDNHDHHN